MTDTAAFAPTALAVQSARIAGRHSLTFVLDQVKAGRDGRHFLEGLILLTIVQANIAHLDRDPELQRAYSDYSNPPPDELRRPISVSAIAHSLRLPYETTRRRVQQLVDQGDCVAVGRGVIAPLAALASPRHLVIVEATYRNVRSLYLRLKRLGVLRDLPPAEVVLTGAAPLRAVARISSDYFLRVLDILIREIGDLAQGLVLLDVLRANTEHLSDFDRGPDAGASGPFTPDERRKPVTIPMLSARLNIPVETVRRHVGRLIEEQHCLRHDGGLIIPADALGRSPWTELMRDNLGHVNRMFGALAPLGLLREWDAAVEDLAGTPGVA